MTFFDCTFEIIYLYKQKYSKGIKSPTPKQSTKGYKIVYWDLQNPNVIQSDNILEDISYYK